MSIFYSVVLTQQQVVSLASWTPNRFDLGAQRPVGVPPLLNLNPPTCFVVSRS
jgi:hypothetical protein